MTLQQCRYLVEIARSKSISKAADALFVTQPSISRAVRELEDDLQITVFRRTNRGVAFTGEGLELLSYAQIMIEQEENVRHHFSKSAKDGLLKLSIASQHFSFAAEAVSRLIGSLDTGRYELAFMEGKASDVVRQVASGLSVLGILAVSSLNLEYLERSFLAQSLSFTPIAALREHVFLRREHPLASADALSVEQLADYPCLTYRKNDPPQNFAEELSDLQNSSRIVYVQDRGTMDDLLVHTDGYNIGTGCMSPGFISPDIISLPLAVPWKIQIGSLKRNGQSLPAEALLFIEYLSAAVYRAMP